MDRKIPTIAEIMAGMSDQALIDGLPWIRNENGERMSLIELRHYLRERNESRKSEDPDQQSDL